MMYWQKDIETMSREELNKLQLERLKQTIELAGHSPFYSKGLKDNGITADSIQSLDDLQKIPFTTKDDLRNNYPFGMAAIPIKDCVRVHSSSGTTAFSRSLPAATRAATAARPLPRPPTSPSPRHGSGARAARGGSPGCWPPVWWCRWRAGPWGPTA